MSSQLKTLGVVIPAYNEKETIIPLISALLAVDLVGSIVVVDDSPGDETERLVTDFISSGAGGGVAISIIHRRAKGGRGSAVIEGLQRLTQQSHNSVFLEMDADFSHSPGQVPALVKKLFEGPFDMVIASRYLPGSQILNWPLSRRIFSRLANLLARIFLNVGITDYTNGYRCYSRRAAELISNEAGKYGKGFIALSEILVRLKLVGFAVGEIQTTFVNRIRGESSVGWREISQSLVGLLKITWFYWSSRARKKCRRGSTMTWQEKIREEWARRQNSQVKKDGHFPLVFQNFTSDEIVSMVEVVMSGQLTMAHNVRKFEAEFAKFVGAPFAVMVNSGSSANLLAFAVATNPRRRHHLKAGDEVIVPAVCWSTSVWPIMQMGLKPVLVDVVPETLNINLEELKKAITPQTKAVLAVHVLGNATDMLALSVFCAEHGLILIEDTCESLGAKANGKMLGTIGEMGTYSFFFSHHMTTGEGGMVVCQSQEDYDLLRNLRAHGWTRELSNRVALETQHPDVDPRFLFVNVGYNFRPMEIQAALGLKQLEKLPAMNANRKYNNDRIIEALRAHSKWNNQYMFTQPGPEVEPAWFGFCLQLTGKHISKRAAFLKELSQMGVENRPIVSGNFARQPALKLFGIDLIPEDFPGAEQIHQAGFFIGVHTEKLRPDQISDLAHKLLSLF